MTALRNHPGFLNAGAAASLDRMEAAHGGAFNISSLGRTLASQQELVRRYYVVGGAKNRPPYLYAPFRPPENSPHVKNGGEAADVTSASDRNWIKAHPEFGWRFTVSSDPVHMVYFPALDRRAAGTIPASGASGFDQHVLNRQVFLNAHGYRLKADGIFGPATKAAIVGYQTTLRDEYHFYNGASDGIWGPATQAAHERFVAHEVSASAPTQVPAVAGNPFGLGDVRGLQKVAKLHGYSGPIDNVWGAGSAAGFANFLRKLYGGSIARWLRTKYGYVGNDVYGPNMQAALARANAANFRAL